MRSPNQSSPDEPPNELIARACEQVARTKKQGPSANGRLAKDLIPGYTILEEVSRGGQGIVYRATRDSTNHLVAIKVMRWSEVAHMEEKKRFEREIAILGRLSHPNIVGLHDGGVVSDYRYLVMDFVAGESIDAYRRHHNLNIKDTLTLFGKVCRAVQAAHVRGVVHRDLKPHNILVDANGQPHILDFGLAKLIEDECDPEHAVTLMTQTGQFLGSLAWASPEQVAGDANKVDVRTDVYALGLTLYHLLTRRFPYDVVGPTQDVFRNIAHAEPAKPSTHRADVDGELDTIVLKCLSKEPERRYQSAGLLAGDIERYLNGEVIEARRESRLYVLTKTVRRHRGAAVASAVLLVASLAYAATLTVLYQRAASAEARATRKAEQASKLFFGAVETVGFLVGEVSSQLGGTTGQTEVRKVILDGAYTRLLDLAAYNTDDPGLLHETGRAHTELGAIALTLGDVATAERHFADALEAIERVGRERPKDAELRAEHSIALVKMGDMQKRHGHDDQARSFYERALHIDESLVTEHPNNTSFLDNLLWSYERLSHLAVLRADFSEAIVLSDKQIRLAERLLASEPNKPLRLLGAFSAHGMRSYIAWEMEQFEQAAKHVTSALQVGERLLTMAPDHPYYRVRVAAQFLVAAGFDRKQGRFANATEHVQRGLALGRTLVAAEPTVISHQALIWNGYELLGEIHTHKPEPDLQAACESFRRSTETIEHLLELAPDDPQRWHQLAEAYYREYMTARKMGEPVRAQGVLEKVLATTRSTFGTNRESAYLLGLFPLYLEEWQPTDPAALRDALVAANLAVKRTGGNHPAALFELAMLQDALGDSGLALKTLERAASFADPEATDFSVCIQRHIDRLLKNAASLSPDDPQAASEVQRLSVLP